MTHEHWPGEFSYCPHCRTELEPAHIGPSQRMQCPSCGYVHFRNPALGAALVVRDEEGRLLMVKRGPEVTRPGLWSMPAGYVDYGEDIEAAAARELEEETGLRAEIGDPVFVATNFHDPAKVSVCVWFDTEIVGGSLRAGDDAVDARFFALDELPDLAFDTDRDLIARLREER
jgi:ADP-ribose pyrophosphatase YjhB (NUDIX family)